MDSQQLAIFDLARADENQLALDILEAATRDGFFFIRNHGISSDIIDGSFSQVCLSATIFRW